MSDMFHDQAVGVPPKAATSAGHDAHPALQELGIARDRLPANQREALAEATGCAIGTAKIRVFRARPPLETGRLGKAGVEGCAVAQISLDRLKIRLFEGSAEAGAL